MLDVATKRRIDDARDILVGKIPDPKSQVEQITIALIYKFMDDMDTESEELGGTAKFFVGNYKKYSWRKVFNKTRGGQEILLDYREALQKMSENPSLPTIFHTIFRQAYLPYNDPETLKEFLKIIDQFDYDHSEKLGDAFEYLLSVLGSQGDAGQFRTPRHIIDFMVELVEPKKGETILDPACGTAGFLISAYKYILKHNSSEGKDKGDLLTPDERKRLSENISGYDISPDMVRLSLVNMYLHKITEPKITEYDTLTSDTKWNEYFDVVLANPPFMSPKGGIKPHSRFSVQSKRSEALFVDYIAEHLTITGRGAVIVPEGVIFKSDTAFTKLRKMLVEDHYLYGVISLPSGVFNPYSGVKTSILLFDKVIAKLTDKILFAKVENDGFGLGAQRRPVEGSQLEGIVSAIKEFKVKLHRGEEFESNVCTFVEKSKIAESGDYNLSGERYITETHKSNNICISRISDVCIVNAESCNPADKFEREFVYIDISSVENLTGNITLGSPIDITGAPSRARRIIKKGDVLLSTVRPNLKAFAHIDFDVTNQIASTGFAVLSPTEKIESKFLYYLIKDDRVVNQMIQRMDKGAYPSINQTDVSALEIPLPSIEEQRAIVAEIEGYQKIIDAARTIADNYRPQITIDPSWQMVELGEVCDVRDGTHDSPKYVNDGYPLITSKNIKDGVVDFSDVNLISKEDFDAVNKRSKVDNGDIIMPMIGSIGSPIIVSSDREFAIKNVALIKFGGNDNVIAKYVWVILQSQLFEKYISDNKRGVTQNFLSLKDIRSFRLPMPDLETQQQIVAEIEREQAAVDSAKELIEIFTQKITNRIAQIWNE